MRRDYPALVSALGIQTPADRESRMRYLVDLVWDQLHETGISWVGFYLPSGAGELILGPRRNKPACSPIGMHGACGVAFGTRRPMIVRDVRELGDAYVACDPRDQSELVIPCFEENGDCWAVLDLDSHDVGAFDEADLAGLQSLLVAGGLTKP